MYICGKEFNFFLKRVCVSPKLAKTVAKRLKSNRYDVLHVVLLMQIMHIRIERFALNYLEELSNCETANLF